MNWETELARQINKGDGDPIEYVKSLLKKQRESCADKYFIFTKDGEIVKRKVIIQILNAPGPGVSE